MPRSHRSLDYTHCDVFSSQPFGGNSLTVFPDAGGLDAATMLAITQEMRHFESIFLIATGDTITARIFDLTEELPFAGHPLIGAACALHRASGDAGPRRQVLTLAGGRQVSLRSEERGSHYRAWLDQGQPRFLATLDHAATADLVRAFNLTPADLAPLPAQVITTGLRYLVLPLTGGLDRARIVVPDLDRRLRVLGADYAYLLDVTRFEGRHWTNDGRVEDVATGSAAGIVGAFALRHGLWPAETDLPLSQGQHAGRLSRLIVTTTGSPEAITGVTVAGDVAFVGTGRLTLPG